MLPLLAFAKLNLLHDLKALWGWLTHRTTAQLACMGLGALALLFYFQRNDARHDAVNYRRQRDEIKAQLDSISTAKNEQGKRTEQSIGKAHDKIVYVDRKAKEVEAAPLPGNCTTPGAVRSADL